MNWLDVWFLSFSLFFSLKMAHGPKPESKACIASCIFLHSYMTYQEIESMPILVFCPYLTYVLCVFDLLPTVSMYWLLQSYRRELWSNSLPSFGWQERLQACTLAPIIFHHNPIRSKPKRKVYCSSFVQESLKYWPGFFVFFFRFFEKWRDRLIIGNTMTGHANPRKWLLLRLCKFYNFIICLTKKLIISSTRI